MNRPRPPRSCATPTKVIIHPGSPHAVNCSTIIGSPSNFGTANTTWAAPSTHANAFIRPSMGHPPLSCLIAVVHSSRWCTCAMRPFTTV